MMRPHLLVILSALVVQTTAGQTSEFPPPVREVLSEHCFRCHGPEKQKSRVRLDTLSTDLVKHRAAAETWHDTLNVVQRGEMPPDDEPDMSRDERQVLVSWIRSRLEAAATAAKGAGDGVVLRRLNREEYRHTMTDLLGVSGNYGAKLPADPVSADGFANNGAALGMSALQLEQYLESAREALSDVIQEGSRPVRTESRMVTSSAKGFQIGNENISEGGRVLGRAGVFAGDFGREPEKRGEIPLTGRFTIRVRARAELRPGQPTPILRVVYGHKAPGAIATYEELATVEITNAAMREFDFHGRARSFPNARRVGEKWIQFAALENALDDGGELPEREMVKKGKRMRPGPYQIDPDFPKIVVESLQLIGNEFEQWPPAEHRRILFAATDEESPAYARDVLARFLGRAWRRPISDGELHKYLAHFNQLRGRAGSFAAALRGTLAVALASPNFLYLVEPKATTKSRRLTPHELASRLSYFLWSSMPDERLTELADGKELRRAKVLRREVKRLLADPKSDRFVNHFTTQWLDLNGVERVAVNPEYYPGFDPRLESYMVRESQLFFGEILRANESALRLIDADFTMANAALARHYGLTGPKSQRFERVALAGTGRPGGLLAHGAMHLANSNGEDSHLINRAVWIRERLLHDPPSPPPPNVPAIDSTDPDFAKLPAPKQLELHRADPACNDCHRNIDPWGVALENFDAVGQWRDEIRRPKGSRKKRRSDFERLPVVASATLPDGHEVDGIEGLKSYILNERRDQFVHALVSKLVVYALGRSLEFTDEAEIKRLSARFAGGGYKLPALIGDIVASELFQRR